MKKAINEKKPYFMYLAYSAPHWPLQAKPEDIAKYKGVYNEEKTLIEVSPSTGNGSEAKPFAMGAGKQSSWSAQITGGSCTI